eukprot:SAG25_NODE_4994_length_718_cov_1.911147_1_plen_56_part_01
MIDLLGYPMRYPPNELHHYSTVMASRTTSTVQRYSTAAVVGNFLPVVQLYNYRYS